MHALRIYTHQKPMHALSIRIRKIIDLYYSIGSKSEVGKHPDLLVGPPTSTVFPTNDRNFERSQFFEKIFEKI